MHISIAKHIFIHKTYTKKHIYYLDLTFFHAEVRRNVSLGSFAIKSPK